MTSSKRGWEKALPCLRDNADAVIDVGRPTTLPFQSMRPPDFRRVTAPKSFDRELDLSFPTTQPGANGLQLLFYSSDDSPRRVLGRLDRSIQALQQLDFAAAREIIDEDKIVNRQRFQVEITMRSFFDRPTLGGLAELIDAGAPAP